MEGTETCPDWYPRRTAASASREPGSAYPMSAACGSVGRSRRAPRSDAPTPEEAADDRPPAACHRRFASPSGRGRLPAGHCRCGSIARCGSACRGRGHGRSRRQPGTDSTATTDHATENRISTRMDRAASRPAGKTPAASAARPPVSGPGIHSGGRTTRLANPCRGSSAPGHPQRCHLSARPVRASRRAGPLANRAGVRPSVACTSRSERSSLRSQPLAGAANTPANTTQPPITSPRTNLLACTPVTMVPSFCGLHCLAPSRRHRQAGYPAFGSLTSVNCYNW